MDFSACVLERTFGLVSLLCIHDSAPVILACQTTLLLPPELNKWGAVLLIFGRLNLFQHSDFKVNPALVFSISSNTTKTGPTMMKKTAVSAVSWNQLPIFLFFFFLLLGGWLNPSLPIKQHVDYIFSQIRQSLAVSYRFWKCMNEFKRKCFLFFCFVFCLFVWLHFLFCFVLCLSTYYSFSTKRILNSQVHLK